MSFASRYSTGRATEDSSKKKCVMLRVRNVETSTTGRGAIIIEEKDASLSGFVKVGQQEGAIIHVRNVQCTFTSTSTLTSQQLQTHQLPIWIQYEENGGLSLNV
jgi:hypothetical protein